MGKREAFAVLWALLLTGAGMSAGTLTSPVPAPQSPISTPTLPVPPPSPIPTLTPTGSPIIPGLAGLPGALPPWWPVLGGLCGAVILLLGVLALLFLFRRRRPQPPKSTRPLPSAPPTPPSLEAVVSGRPRRWPLPLDKESLTVGRAPDNDLVITPDFQGWETVSRRHARLYRLGEEWAVEDLGSTNGIYVNGRRTGRNLLRDGWELKIGQVSFTFRAGKGGRT